MDYGYVLTRWNRDLVAWQRRVDAWLEGLAAEGRIVAKDVDAAIRGARTRIGGGGRLRSGRALAQRPEARAHLF
jgi:hypothetical protein